jgi:hypothetical protein
VLHTVEPVFLIEMYDYLAIAAGSKTVSLRAELVPQFHMVVDLSIGNQY